MRSTIKIILFISLLLLMAPAAFTQNAAALLKEAQDDLAKNQDSLALIKANQFLALKPDKIPGLLVRAEACNTLKMYDIAYNDFTKIIKKDPKITEAYQGLALAEICQKNPQDAIKTCDQGIAVDFASVNFLLYIYKSMAQDSTGDFAGERESYSKAIGIIKNLKENKTGINLAYKHYFIDLSKIDYNVLNYQEALDSYAAALQMDPSDKGAPNNSYIYYLRGKTNVALHNYSSALTDLNTSITKFDALPEAFFCRGQAYRKQKQYQNAINDFTKAIQLNSKYYEAYAERGACYDDQKQYDNALADYAKSVSLNNKDSVIKREYRRVRLQDYESKRTYDQPVVKINYPEFKKQELVIPFDKTVTYLNFEVSDKSKIDSILINNKPVSFNKDLLNPRINQPVNIDNAKTIVIRVVDIYKNKVQVPTTIKRVNLFAKTGPYLEMRANIFAGNDDHAPLKSTRVVIADKDDNPLDTLFTSAMGTLKFKDLIPDSNYTVFIESDDSAMVKLKNYVLADLNGKSVMTVSKKNGKFRFDISPYDQVLLPLMTFENFPVNLELKGKILLDQNTPLANATIKLTGEPGEAGGTVITNDLGVFVFRNPADKAAFNKTLTLDTNGLKLSNGENILLTDDNGSVHSTVAFNKLKPLKFTIAKADRPSFMRVTGVDPWLKASKLTAANPEMIISENIYYPLSEYEVSQEAATVLDKAVDLLKKDPHFRIEISSNTDSKGNADSNLVISQKRAKAAVAYIISKGIPAEKISGQGYGDQRLLNKCGRGIECPEELHQQNRRTEFKILYQESSSK